MFRCFWFGRRSDHKARTAVILCATALAVVATASDASAARPLPKPVGSIGTPVVSSGQVRLVGSFHYGKKTIKPSWRWTITGETDASGAPLPVQLSSGTGGTVPVPVVGGYKLDLTVKMQTPKTAAHQAAVKSANVTAQLGGYTAIGTQVPSVKPFPSGDTFCTFNNVPFSVPDNSSTAVLPQASSCGPSSVTGACSWEPTPPQSPIDLYPNRDGVISGTPLTVYGGKFACTGGGIWAVPYVRIIFAYYDPSTGALTDSCELELSGVTSFTVPPEWGGSISYFAALLTFGPNGYFYADYTRQTPYAVRTHGTIDVCQTYHLPAFKG